MILVKTEKQPNSDGHAINQRKVEGVIWVRMYAPMSDAPLENLDSQEIWVDLYEAAEITGYSVVGLRGIVSRMSQLPEAEREVRVRKRTGRWELWLPNLINYLGKPKHGPRNK